MTQKSSQGVVRYPIEHEVREGKWKEGSRDKNVGKVEHTTEGVFEDQDVVLLTVSSGGGN